MNEMNSIQTELDVARAELLDLSTRHTDNKLQTDYLPTEFRRRLLNTYYTARTAIEEQGVTTLYLALGMLQWYESESSDMLRRAPLILIPVEISRTSVRASFRIMVKPINN